MKKGRKWTQEQKDKKSKEIAALWQNPLFRPKLVKATSMWRQNYPVKYD